MTTEILRNQLYRQGGAAPAPAAGSGGGHSGGASVMAAAAAPGPASVSRLADVALVVLDEVHYLGDPSRGSVWEEVSGAARVPDLVLWCRPSMRRLTAPSTVSRSARHRSCARCRRIASYWL